MPTYTVTAPDGKQYDITAPEGATQEQVLSYAKENYKSQVTTEVTPPTTLDNLGRTAGLAGRALITGASAIPNAIAGFGAGAYNIGAGLLGSESRMPDLGAAQQQAMTNLGVPQAQTLPEKVMAGGIEAMTGTGVNAALAGASKIPSAVSAFTENLPTQLAASGTGGAIAPISYAGIKGVTGSDLAATIGSLGLSSVGAGLAGGLMNKATGAPVSQVTMDEVKQRAQRAYTSMEYSGVTVKPLSAQNMVKSTEQTLIDKGYVPENTPKIGNLLSNFTSIIGDARVPFRTLESMRSKASTLKGDENKDTARLAGIVVDQIDNYMAGMSGKDIMTNKGNLDEAVKNVMAARKDWRNMSRAQTLEDALNVANIRADNPTVSESEAIRQGFQKIAKSPSFNLFSQDEQNAIRAVSKGTPFDTLLSMAGKFNPERSQLIAGASLAGALSNPMAIAIPATGFAADKLQKYLRSTAAQNTVKGILGGSLAPTQPQYPWLGLGTIGQQK
jgi:hypothetical protein